jgi:hypothetical protein
VETIIIKFLIYVLSTKPVDDNNKSFDIVFPKIFMITIIRQAVQKKKIKKIFRIKKERDLIKLNVDFGYHSPK